MDSERTTSSGTTNDVAQDAADDRRQDPVDTITPGRRPGGAHVGDERGAQARRRRVAVLCPQSRLRRLLRLSLLADGYDVVEWSGATRPQDPGVDALVADLDSLRQGVSGVLARLREWCVGEATAVLFISVYPLDLPSLDLQSLGHNRPLDGLQPPFPPMELPDRLRRLLDMAASAAAGPAPAPPRRRDDANGAGDGPA